MFDLMDENERWAMLEKPEECPTALATITEALCTHRANDIRPVIEFLEPVLKRVYDSQRMGAAAIMAEFINQRFVFSAQIFVPAAKLTVLLDVAVIWLLLTG